MANRYALGARGRISRKRKSRRNNRSRRTYRGGALTYIVTLSTIPCNTSSCEVSKFIMDTKGNTFLENEAPFGNPTTTTFVERVLPLIKSPIVNKFKTIRIDTQPANQEDILPVSLNKISVETLNEFKYIGDTILGKNSDEKSLTSPAFYRAILLATSKKIDKNNQVSVETMICDDNWVGKLTSIVPYSLLNALYYNLDIGMTDTSDTPKITPKASNELAQAVNAFLSNYVAEKIPGILKNKDLSFADLQFINPATIAKELCEPSIGRSTRIANIAQQNILTNAHKELRLLYNTHLENVVVFIRTILSLRHMGHQQSFKIRLNEEFVTNSKGAVDVLEDRISEARTMLFNHYLAVETIYKKAIFSIKGLGQGIAQQIPRPISLPDKNTGPEEEQRNSYMNQPPISNNTSLTRSVRS
jgi:hypothetical protein